MEEWRDIEGYEGLYQVSSCGRVKALNYNRTGIERILRQTKDALGYKRIMLCKDSKRKLYLVHRLVAATFLDNPNNYPCVNHKDECKYNNFVENLEFCTHEYNNNYGTRTERQSKALTGKHHTEERKRKISKAMIGKQLSEEHKSKISKANKGKHSGKKNPMYGKQLSEERKRKISESMTGSNNPGARKVQCINTGKIFDTVKEAANWSGTSSSAIANQINGKYKTAGKSFTGERLTWRYYEE